MTILARKQLNRATLQRQMLLERSPVPVPAAIDRLAGMQAQLASAPFVGLWTRIKDFRSEDLSAAINNREVIKATWIRATLHLCTTADYVKFRTTLQPLLSGAGEAIAKGRGADFDRDRLLEVARKYIGEKPRTFADISEMLAELMPDQDVGPLRYTVRTHIPLVQVPISSGWSYPSKPEFTLAESWIAKPISPEDNLKELVFRYLAAFGPASVTDMQTWLGMKLKDTFEKMRPELQVYKDEGRRELFDLPDVPLPDPETPAPVRFLPEYDNVLLSHSNRTRVIADEHRSKVYLPGLRVAATILVDGFVGGVWKIEKTKSESALIIEPFAELSSKVREELAKEGEQLLRFVDSSAKKYELRITLTR
jgi:hypothetical protein